MAKTKNNHNLSKRRSKPPTSFRKHKILQVKSGRKFKQKRNLQKKARKAVSDSSFSISYLTESLVSTPVSCSGSGKRQKRRTPKAVKGGGTSTSDSVIVSGNVETDDKVVTPTLCEDLKYKFRNDHITYYDKDFIKPKVSNPTSDSVAGPSDVSNRSQETIVIEDDDDPTLTPTDVGNIMLNMLNPEVSSSDMKEDDSVRLNPCFEGKEKDSNTLTPDEKANKTIVLDDTADEEEIIIVNDKDFPSLPSTSKQTIIPPSPRTQLNLPPLTSSNMQQITSRYPSSAPEFIPLFSKNSSFTRHKADFRRGRGKLVVTKRLQTIPACNKLRSSLKGTVSRAHRNPSNPSGRQESNVWQSSRRQEHANVVVASGPTVFEGDKEKTSNSKGSLRPIVIDGSNVAMSHGVNNVFSVRGIELTIDYFKSRGHKEIVAFLPQWRSKYNQSSDKQLLDKLESERYIIFTPSREVDNQRINSYDDTFILVNVVNRNFGILFKIRTLF